MRIVAGLYRGHILADPTNNATHPMSEKIRGALFNSLGDIGGLSVLDAYAGTGSVAIEAISRGAQSALAIDNDPEAFKCITKNLTKLNLHKSMSVVCANVITWSTKNQTLKFDIVVADAPFNIANDTLLNKLSLHVVKNGILVASIPSDFNPKPLVGFMLLRTKLYGNAKLHFYKHATNAVKDV